MQRYSVLFAVILLPFWLHAQGVDFEHLSWGDALAKARKEHKMVFLDAYTLWCGPCKLMVSNVFPDSSVGAFFNSQFVNLKMDMEHGDGIILAKKYGIAIFPTLLFFDDAGNVQHRAPGFHGVKDLIDLAKAATDLQNNMAALEKRYAAGERTPEFLQKLTALKSAALDPNVNKVAQAYLKTQDNYSTPANMRFIMQYADDPFSDAFYYLIHNRAKFDSVYTKATVEDRLDQIFENYLQAHPKLQLGEVQRLYGTVYPEQGELLASSYRLTYYRKREDLERFVLSAVDHYTRFPCDEPDELIEISKIFSEEVTDPAMLKQALEWVKSAIKIQEHYYAYETQANLYAKLDQKKAAIKSAKRAIELAEQNDEEALEAKALLEILEQ